MNAILQVQSDGSFILAIKHNVYLISSANATNPIAKSAFYTVYKATFNDVTIAIKQLSKRNNDMDKIRQENQVMNTLKECNNIIRLIDSGEDENYFYSVMEYYDKGTLTSIIDNDILKSEKEVVEIFRQICYGMCMMHQRGMVHRNLKTDNILVQSYNDPSYLFNLYTVITDFKLIKNSTDLKMTLNIGNETAKAPEVYTGIYDKRADVYSLGCILYKMLTRADPFKGSTIEELREEKKQEKLIVGKVPLSQFTMNLLEGCLQCDKNLRMLPEELYSILKIESLYAGFKGIELGGEDSEKYINLMESNRKLKETAKRNEDVKTEKNKMEQIVKNALKEEIKAFCSQQIKEEVYGSIKALNTENSNLKEELNKLRQEHECNKIMLTTTNNNFEEMKQKMDMLGASISSNMQEFGGSQTNSIAKIKEIIENGDKLIIAKAREEIEKHKQEIDSKITECNRSMSEQIGKLKNQVLDALQNSLFTQEKEREINSKLTALNELIESKVIICKTECTNIQKEEIAFNEIINTKIGSLEANVNYMITKIEKLQTDFTQESINVSITNKLNAYDTLVRKDLSHLQNEIKQLSTAHDASNNQNSDHERTHIVLNDKLFTTETHNEKCNEDLLQNAILNKSAALPSEKPKEIDKNYAKPCEAEQKDAKPKEAYKKDFKRKGVDKKVDLKETDKKYAIHNKDVDKKNAKQKGAKSKI